MVTESGDYNYAMTVNAQGDEQTTTHNLWAVIQNAVGDNPNFAKSVYRRKKYGKTYKYTTPMRITCHDYRLDIPENAYVKKVTVEVCMKIDNSKVKVKAPYASFMVYDGKGKVAQQKSAGKTGWYNSTYRVYQNRYISTSESVFSYEFSGTEWNKIKYPTKQLNQAVMGVDLTFETPTSMPVNAVGIYVKWARIKVDYELCGWYLNLTHRDETNPLEVPIDTEYSVKMEFGNNLRGNCENQDITVHLPFGTELVSYSCTDGSSFTEIDAFTGKYNWNCVGKAKSKNNLALNLISHTAGNKNITCLHGDKTYTEYIFATGFMKTNYGEASIESSDIIDGQEACFKFKTKAFSADGTITYTVVVDGENQTNPNKLSPQFKEYYNNPNGQHNNLVRWGLHTELCSDPNVSIESYTNDTITFNIPKQKEIELVFEGCFMIVTEGENTLYLVNGDTGDSYTYEYNSLTAQGLNIPCTMENLIWRDHNVITDIESDGYIIRCTVKESDRVMVEGVSTARANMEARVNYIGCVALTHTHYDPDADFDNKGLKEQYKNIKYMGKSGEIDEKISLKLKAPPRDWTTFEGLAELDKPVPVNACRDAFEGDVLNHRGWVELKGVKNVKKTNPLYYAGELEVDYLTHNILSRFTIKKGNKIETKNMPDILGSVLDSGDEFATITYESENEDGELETLTSNGYFIVDTDGTYAYDSDAVENQRTLVSLSNEQYLHIRSEEILPAQSQISFSWNSTKISENRENNISRIISLVNNEGKVLLEYEYSDFKYEEDDDFYSCLVTIRVRNGDDWIPITRRINLANDVESLNLKRDAETGELIYEVEPDIDDEYNEESVEDDEDTIPVVYNDYMYGSLIHFKLNGNELEIVDEGYNGRELTETIRLEQENVFYQVDFHNTNTDLMEEDIIHFLDFEVLEPYLTSDFGNAYSGMYVSSLPIRGKTVLFTRESEEGTIYYLKDDGTDNFTYIQEPYYMYYCGVDLKAEETIHLFNLNNSYRIFYLQNGLVRLGFDRIEGRLFLAKYDPYTRKYINVAVLQLEHYSNFEVKDYSDDKISVKADDITFTMYRGHPYVVINHKEEDINIKTIFNMIWGESVNNLQYDFPMFFELENNQNQLPACVGGNDLISSCLTIDDPINEDVGQTPTLTLTKNTNTVYNGEYCYFTVNGNVTDVDEEIPFEGTYDGVFGKYTIEGGNSSSPSVEFTSQQTTTYVNQRVNPQVILLDKSGDPIENKRVNFYIDGD